MSFYDFYIVKMINSLSNNLMSQPVAGNLLSYSSGSRSEVKNLLSNNLVRWSEPRTLTYNSLTSQSEARNLLSNTMVSQLGIWFPTVWWTSQKPEICDLTIWWASQEQEICELTVRTSNHDKYVCKLYLEVYKVLKPENLQYIINKHLTENFTMLTNYICFLNVFMWLYKSLCTS